MTMHTKSILFIVLILTGCDLLESKSEICYPGGDNMEAFSAELDQLGFNFQRSSKAGCILVSGLDEGTHKEIRESIFGVEPPEGLSQSWPGFVKGIVGEQEFQIDEDARIRKRLKDEGIETKTMTYFGVDFLVWEEKNDAQVRKILRNN